MTSQNEINPKNYLTKLQRNPNKEGSFIVPIEVYSYYNLGFTIRSITNVCIGYLKENNEKQNINVLEIVDLLELQNQLIPLDEMELLDELNK